MNEFDNMVEVLISVSEDGTGNDNVDIVSESILQDTYEGMDKLDLKDSICIDEALELSDLKVVKEKNGKGFSLKINGVEYRYVSDSKSPESLMKTVQGIMKHNPGKAMSWLKKNAVNYYGGKDKRKVTSDTKKSRDSKLTVESNGVTCPECGYSGNSSEFHSSKGNLVCPECGYSFKSVGESEILSFVGILDEKTGSINEATEPSAVGPYKRGDLKVGNLYDTDQGTLAIVDNVEGVLTVVDDKDNVYTVDSGDFNKLNPVSYDDIEDDDLDDDD